MLARGCSAYGYLPEDKGRGALSYGNMIELLSRASSGSCLSEIR